MILIVSDSLDARLSFQRYLRKNGLLCYAPPSADLETAVTSGGYTAAVFLPPFSPALLAMTTSGTARVAAGSGANEHSRELSCFENPFSPELFDFLADIEGMGMPLRVGALMRSGGRLYIAGYELKLTPAERAAVEYLLRYGVAAWDELAKVCIYKPYPGSDDRQRQYICTVVSRVNGKAAALGGRKLIEFCCGYRLRPEC